jgi:hypothetical protein
MTASIDSQLREYSAYFDGLTEELTVEDIVVERVSTGRVQPLRPRRTDSRRGWLVATGAAVALIALIAAAALVLRSRAAPTPPAIDPPSPRTAPVFRTGAGSIDTSLGAMNWARYTTPDSDVRLLERADGGPALWSIDTEALWASENGVDWTAIDLPVPIHAESVGSRVIGDVFWLQTFNPTTLWRSASFRPWEEIDLGAIPVPESFNVNWTITLGVITELEDGAAVTWRAWPDLSSVGLVGPFTATHTDLFLDPGGLGFGIGQPPYEIHGTRVSNGVEEAVAVVEIVPLGEDSGSWRVIDVDTGAEYAYFSFDVEGRPGDPVEFATEGLLLVDGAGESLIVEPPWVDAQQSATSLVGSGNQLLAVTHSTTGTSLVQIWSSDDGRSWQNLGEPAFTPPGSTVAYLTESEEMLHAHVYSEDGEQQLVSYDGTNWDVLPTPAGVSSDRVRPFLGGYAAWSSETLWLSADGIAWEELSLADFGLRIDPLEFDGGFAGGLVGERLVLRAWSDAPGGDGSTIVVLEADL